MPAIERASGCSFRDKRGSILAQREAVGTPSVRLCAAGRSVSCMASSVNNVAAQPLLTQEETRRAEVAPQASPRPRTETRVVRILFLKTFSLALITPPTRSLREQRQALLKYRPPRRTRILLPKQQRRATLVVSYPAHDTTVEPAVQGEHLFCETSYLLERQDLTHSSDGGVILLEVAPNATTSLCTGPEVFLEALVNLLRSSCRVECKAAWSIFNCGDKYERQDLAQLALGNNQQFMTALRNLMRTRLCPRLMQSDFLAVLEDACVRRLIREYVGGQGDGCMIAWERTRGEACNEELEFRGRLRGCACVCGCLGSPLLTFHATATRCWAPVVPRRALFDGI